MDNKKEKILILLAGQSNMAGRGFAEPEDLIAVPRVEFLRPDLKWAPAIEPITRDRDFVGTLNADGTRIVPHELGARYFDAYMKIKSSHGKNKEFSHE